MTNVEKLNELKKEFKANILQFFVLMNLTRVKLINNFGVSVPDIGMLGEYYLSQETVTHVDKYGQVYYEDKDNGHDIMDLDVGDIAYILDELIVTNYIKDDDLDI